MNSTHIFEEHVVFGRDIKPEINACLMKAVAVADDFELSRACLYEALDLSKELQPDQLVAYIALYKLCFYRGHLDEAERVALDALQESAQRGGFDANWTRLDVDATDWTVDEGPARVYLYSLKALAFIRLRQGEHDSAKQILARLQQLDTDDLVGGSVIMTLAEAI